jgi:hypothetical protein
MGFNLMYHQIRAQVVNLAASVQRGSPKNRDKPSE